MTTSTAAPVARRSIQWSKVAAVIAWGFGVFTTWLFFAAVAPGLPWLIGLIAAGLVQWVLTIAERPLWRKLLGRRNGQLVILSIIVTLGDALVNAAGLYPYMGRLARTGVGVMLSEVMGVQQAMSSRSAFILAFAFGLVIAGLPEMLWEYDDRR